MNSTKMNYGGPAFPHSSQPLDAQGNPMCGEHSEWGMTLRDYFAGQALAGALADPTCDVSPIELAKIAYREADAMLKAREAKP